MSLIKNKNYITLIFAQFIEQVGDSLTLMTLILWASSMKTASGSSSGNVSLLMFFVGLPIILIGPFAGVFIDRAKKKAVMLGAAVFKGAAVLSIFFFIGEGAYAPLIFSLTILFSAGAQFFLPAKSAFIPDMVEGRDLAAANSISAVITVLVLISGFAAAGFVASAIGFKKTVFIAVAAYCVTVVAVFLIRAEEEEKEKAGPGPAAVWGEFRDGIAHLFDSKIIKFVVRRVAVLMAVIGVFFVALSGKYLSVILAETGISLRHGQALGIMLAILGVGLVMGTVFIDKAVKKISEETIIRTLFPVLGVCVAVLYVWPNYYFLLCAGFAAGMAGAAILGLAETMIQRNTNVKMRGRLFAAYYFIRNSSTTIGTTLAGLIAFVINEKNIVLLCGAALVFYGAVNLIFIKKLLRDNGNKEGPRAA